MKNPASTTALASGCAVLELYPANSRRICCYHREVTRFREKIDRNVREAMNACVTGVKPWPLLLHGLTGRGKTAAALCLMDAARDPVYLRTEAEMCETLNQAHDREFRDSDGRRIFPSNIWYAWTNANLAVLDDLGKRTEPTDARIETVQRALEKRVGKPLIITTELTPKEISKRYVNSIVSRCCGGTICKVGGADRRMAT